MASVGSTALGSRLPVRVVTALILRTCARSSTTVIFRSKPVLDAAHTGWRRRSSAVTRTQITVEDDGLHGFARPRGDQGQALEFAFRAPQIADSRARAPISRSRPRQCRSLPAEAKRPVSVADGGSLQYRTARFADAAVGCTGRRRRGAAVRGRSSASMHGAREGTGVRA